MSITYWARVWTWPMALRSFSSTRLDTRSRSICPNWVRVAAMVGRMVRASCGQFILADASIRLHIRFSSRSDISQRVTSRM